MKAIYHTFGVMPKLQNRYWMVTVTGIDHYCDPPKTEVTIFVKLNEGQSLADWFASGPSVYCRFSFIPDAILFAQPITKKTYDNADKSYKYPKNSR